jgi:hypothetical protein
MPPSHVQEFLAVLPRSCFLFCYALLFALVEIEIEGKDGWAMNLPTWFRRTGRIPRIYSQLMSGKPLTGYHAVMFFIPLFSFHLPWFWGLPFSWQGELRIFTTYLLWNVTWDFLWFLLNPNFGWKHFHAGKVWWHRWLGPVPVDYVHAVWLSTALAALSWMINDHAKPLYEHLYFLLSLLLFTLVVAMLAPFYQRWYLHMRRPGSDERPTLE